jgi:O-antigen/teichoic acid export membrane protein
LILTPFWSAFTAAWFNKDLSWIKKNIKTLLKIWLLLVLIGCFMIFFSEEVYFLWIGKHIEVPKLTSALILLWVLLNSFNGIFSHFFNGIGVFKVQIITSTIAAIITISLGYYLGKNYGLNGIILANVIASALSSIIWPIKYFELVNRSKNSTSL